MKAYLIKRLLLVFPTLVIISLIAFALSKVTPQDQVMGILTMRGVDVAGIEFETYEKVYRELHYDEPLFYFSIVPGHYPKNLNRITDRTERSLSRSLLRKGYTIEQIKQLDNAYNEKRNLLSAKEDAGALIALEKSKLKVENYLDQLSGEYKLKPERKIILPSFRWHGLQNQYHYWLGSIFSEGFGPSITDGRPAASKASKALQWTLSFTIIDLLVSILLGIYLGILFSVHKNRRIVKVLRQVLYVFYAMPLFWLATILVVYFTTDDYGSWTKLFPTVGMDIYPGEPTYRQILYNAEKLILPIVCLTLHSLAYISRMVENGINDELKKDYVLLARSQGLSTMDIVKRDVLRNAMIPSITVFVGALAGAFSGSLVLEVIFNIPGMGRLLFNALGVADWNVVFCLLIILSLITILAYLLGDILYAVFNPRIKYSL